MEEICDDSSEILDEFEAETDNEIKIALYFPNNKISLVQKFSLYLVEYSYAS